MLYYCLGQNMNLILVGKSATIFSRKAMAKTEMSTNDAPTIERMGGISLIMAT